MVNSHFLFLADIIQGLLSRIIIDIAEALAVVNYFIGLHIVFWIVPVILSLFAQALTWLTFETMTQFRVGAWRL